ncbi:MAG: homing endonuclease associated repeat-containing protein [Candidatus Aenigmatarchaeota archaeon]
MIVYAKRDLQQEAAHRKAEKKAEELGRTPTYREIRKDSSMPHPETYRNAFGSYNKAMEEAGLEPNIRFSRPPTVHTREELIGFLKEKADKLGRAPTRNEVRDDKSMPDPKTYYYKFGGHAKALAAAGLKPNRASGKYTRDELIKALRKKAKDMGKTPTIKDMNTDKDMPSATTYSSWFGSYTEALEAAGLRPRKKNKEKDPFLKMASSEEYGDYYSYLD